MNDFYEIGFEGLASIGIYVPPPKTAYLFIGVITACMLGLHRFSWYRFAWAGALLVFALLCWAFYAHVASLPRYSLTKGYSDAASGASIEDVRRIMRTVLIYYPLWISAFPLTVILAMLGPRGMKLGYRLALVTIAVVIVCCFGWWTFESAAERHAQYLWLRQYR